MKHLKKFNESIQNESDFEIVGNNMDEILDAINFINDNYGEIAKSLSIGWKPFIKITPLNNSLLDSNKKSIFVKFEPEGEEKLHIPHINDMLLNNDFKCKLYKVN